MQETSPWRVPKIILKKKACSAFDKGDYEYSNRIQGQMRNQVPGSCETGVERCTGCMQFGGVRGIPWALFAGFGTGLY